MSQPGPTVFSGRYELHRRLGRGGMAEVFLARDLLLDRPVAVKVLAAEFAADPTFVERFRREAQAAANLSHPNIVNVYDWGEERSTYFIVMEYVEGHTLAELLRADGPFDPDRACDVALDVAGALSFAHRNGLIHRDVKPANVLVSPTGQVKVADFGIATAIAGGEAQLTQAGTVMGTATYFSPEQAQGKPVDPRSDLYSLGIVLYEMLVGHPPFTGESPVAIAYQHVQDPPVRPRELGVSVAESLEAITLKLLAKNPANRYPSAEDLRRDLRRYREGQHSLGAAAAAASAPALAPAVQAARAQTASAAYANNAASAPARAATATQAMPAAQIPSPPRRKDDSRRRSVFAAIALVGLLAVLGALVVALVNALGIGDKDETATVETIEVPSFLGDTIEDAEATLAELNLVPSATRVPNDEVPAGEVFAQNPAAGTKVDPLTVIELTVSKGEELTTPNVVNQPLVDAEADIRAAGLEVGETTFIESADIPADSVISQDPPAGTLTQRGTVITLVVSTGPALAPVPDVKNMTEANAVAALVRAGFDYDRMDESSTTVPLGTVIRSDPEAGTMLKGGEKVQIVVSSGRPLGRVPNVVGTLADSAIQAIRSAGFEPLPVFQSVTAGSPDNGRVISQNPVSDTEQELGSTVTIVVGRVATDTSTSTTTTTTAPPP